MRLMVEIVGRSLHPSEVVVEVQTIHGPERLVVNERSLKNNTIDIGHPVALHEDAQYLVELPAETDSGAWRVWVDKNKVVEGKLEAAE
jgi:hypothetical protein